MAKEFFGDLAINGLLAHEYGHALQCRAGLVNEQTSSTLVREQQADCFAGTYMRWVAEGHSPRFTLNTTRALDQVMAGAIAGRDPISTYDSLSLEPPSHGTALDRVSAFQKGFDVGAEGCATIDSAEIQQRRGNLPQSLFDPASPQSDIAIDDETLSTLLELLGQIFAPADVSDAVACLRRLFRGPAAACGLLSGVQHDRCRSSCAAADWRASRRAPVGPLAGGQHRLVDGDVALHARSSARAGPGTQLGGGGNAHRLPDRGRAAQDGGARFAGRRATSSCLVPAISTKRCRVCSPTG